MSSASASVSLLLLQLVAAGVCGLVGWLVGRRERVRLRAENRALRSTLARRPDSGVRVLPPVRVPAVRLPSLHVSAYQPRPSTQRNPR